MDLPTVEECRTFLEVVNRGRVAGGLEPLEYLDFDDARPNQPNNCLSARNLFYPLGIMVFTFDVHLMNEERVETFNRVTEAIGVPEYDVATKSDMAHLPPEIKVVTDAFDNYSEGLHDRLVEAGVVED